MRKWRVRAGQSLVEMALVLPIMTLLMLGAIDLGRIFYAKVTVANAARVAAEYAANPAVLTYYGNNLTTARNQVKNRAVMEAANQNVTIAQSDVTFNSNFTPGTIYTVVVLTRFSPITPLVSSLLGAGTVDVTHTVELRHSCNSGNLAAGTCVYPAPTS